jgi:hypothetical protein
MKGPDYRRAQNWTRFEVAAMLALGTVTVTMATLYFTNIVGSWVVFIQCGITVLVGLHRYQVEAVRRDRQADVRD